MIDERGGQTLDGARGEVGVAHVAHRPRRAGTASKQSTALSTNQAKYRDTLVTAPEFTA